MKALAFLLLLDYSGSMDQTIAGKTKIETLKNEVRALLSTEKPDVLSAALVFGTNPQQGCRDIKSLELATGTLQRELGRLSPGAMGKTPLAAGLKRMGALAQTQRVRSSIVVTDGADSCGEDPCKVLQEMDRNWKPGRGKFKIQIIGFDLKSDRSRFECFKKLELKNIEVSLSEAGGGNDLRNQFKKNQMADYDEGAAFHDTDTKRLKGLQKNKITPKKSGIDGKDAKSDSKNKNNEEALLEVVGAPTTAKFSAKGKVLRDWSGPYAVRLPPGSFDIHFDNANSADQKLDLGAGTHTKIPWARLMRLSETQVQIQTPKLNLKWTPSETTKAVHGDAAVFSTNAVLEGNTMSLPKVPFGEWQIEVTSPPWLKGLLKPMTVQVPLGDSNFAIDLQTYYGSELRWIENPDPSKSMVLELKNAETEEHHLIPAGQARIPVPKDFQFQWLHP